MISLLPGLYIGGVSDVADVQHLQQAGITHILTVDSVEQSHLQQSFQTKFVRLSDDSSADLLSFLPDCLLFLKEAMEIPGSSVLVHCHAGVSRSAAVIAAYLMKSTRCTFEEVYGRLQNIKPDIKMNEEFVNQLTLFETMGCDINMNSASYKQYRLQKVTEKFPELQRLPCEIFAVDPDSLGQNKGVLFRCRKCRRSLFREGSILNHALGAGPAAFANKRLTSIQATNSNSARCTSFFVEPVQWMENTLLGVMDGQLLCPKCNSKLGSFNWYGEQCSCGRWVTPAFQVHKNRVDEVKTFQIHGR